MFFREIFNLVKIVVPLACRGREMGINAIDRLHNFLFEFV